MSLLLDALKRAAQEKLEKQRQDETGVGAATQSAAIGGKAPPTEDGLSLELAPADDKDTGGNKEVSEVRLTQSAAGTDLRMHRADVLASELEAFIGSNTEQRSAESESQPAAGSGMFAATPAAAAGLFIRKPNSGMQSKRFWILAGSVAAALLVGILFIVYLGSLNKSNVMVDRLQGARSKSAADLPQDNKKIESDLLIEQEDIGSLLEETLADKNTSAQTEDKPAAVVTQQAAAANVTASPAPGAMRVKVQKNRQQPLHDILLQAYEAYQRNDMAAAESGYRQALARSPENRDALLGFAAVATQKGEPAAALESYTTLLRLDPNDDLALAGISGLKQNIQGVGADESTIKNLLLKRPESAQLHFALGNVYAAGNDWPKSQSAYFDAHRYDPQNPDYAYNLAISLEHLQQPEPALRYYELALNLAGQRRANFDLAQAADRISLLQTKTPSPDAR
ncbi:MAG TPA: tetratricopeptide repeat protein [Gammaproteobacteria bacterium]